MPFYQTVSIVGSALLLFAYGGMQVGKIEAMSYLYQMCNLAGAACLTYSVIRPFNSGVFITELAWPVFSVVGLWKTSTAARPRRSAEDPAPVAPAPGSPPA